MSQLHSLPSVMLSRHLISNTNYLLCTLLLSYENINLDVSGGEARNILTAFLTDIILWYLTDGTVLVEFMAWCCICDKPLFDTSRPQQNGQQFADNIFKYIFFNEHVYCLDFNSIFTDIFFHFFPIVIKSLVSVMAVSFQLPILLTWFDFNPSMDK